MHDFVSTMIKLGLIVLAFLILPFMNLSTQKVSEARQAIINNTNEYLDGLSDLGYITKDGLDDYYRKINSHGLSMNASITVSIRVPSTDIHGNPVTLDVVKYNDLNLLDASGKRLLNKGDIVYVRIDELGISPWRNMIYKFLNYDSGAFTYGMSDVVE